MNTWIYENNLDPVLFSLGPLRIGWYGLMYAVSFLFVYWMLMRSARRPGALIPAPEVPNILTYMILGVVVGGRLGWVLFYGGAEYLAEPWRIVETWKGGMSFHGGLLGVVVSMMIYCRRHKIAPMALTDYAAAWAAFGLFAGRVGNFINGELYGKPTDGTWGVIFASDPHGVPRHPSQLYEAALEGLLILFVLMLMRGRTKTVGLQGAVFFILYGLGRMAVEFVRLPDEHLGYLFLGFVTMGQTLSLPMVIGGAAWAAWLIAKQRKAQAG